MSALGPHAAFVIGAYLAAAVILGGLIAWVVLDRLQLRRALDELEARGVTRRSEPGEGPRR